MSSYKPPFTISNKIINLISSISSLLTELSIKNEKIPNPKLRKENRIKTIQASLAIENNSLTLDQVTDIINGKRVLGEEKEIHEVKNAFQAYEILLNQNPYKIESLLYIHKILMMDLVKDSGRFRDKGVGIFAGEKLVHMAPPAKQIPYLVEELFNWLNESEDIHPLIKSSVFHYEFEFIHPFSDGNGRLGRMWQTLLLYKWNPLFAWLPVETLIKERQDEYYNVLGECDKLADSGKFIEFMLDAIFKSLLEYKETDQEDDQESDQVKKVLNVLKNRTLSAKNLMEELGLKHSDTFRKNYLLPALNNGKIEMTIPDKPKSRNQKYRKK